MSVLYTEILPKGGEFAYGKKKKGGGGGGGGSSIIHCEVQKCNGGRE